MNILDTFVRRAHRRGQRVGRPLGRSGRWAFALALAAGLMTSALGPPTSVHADPPRDPAARLQVVVKSVHIIDDTDWLGSGELKLYAYVTGESLDGPPGTGGLKVEYEHAFS